MTAYICSETVACWVTYTGLVEAESAEEAERIFKEGGAEFTVEPEIGDSLDSYDAIFDIRELAQPAKGDQK